MTLPSTALLQHPNGAERLLRKLVEAKKADLYSLSPPPARSMRVSPGNFEGPRRVRILAPRRTPRGVCQLLYPSPFHG